MNLGFWKDLNKPVMALAPMANVTDAAFRKIIASRGKPDVMWTEFVSCDGLLSEGQENLLVDLWYDESERPIVAQIFGGKSEKFYECAQLIKKLGFDGIDINMGCPDRAVEKQGAGAALIKDPERAKAIIQETKRGAEDLPVSVKTRIGYNKDITEEWAKELLEADPAVITFHARTRKEMSKVPAHWDAVARAVQVRDKAGSETLIFGNGDVESLVGAEKKVQETGADGAMIGRGIFGNPWLFNREVDRERVSIEDRLLVMLEHTFLFAKRFGERKNFSIMKKHYKAYVNGFPEAKAMRVELMATKIPEEVLAVVQNHFPNIKPPA